MSVVVTGRPKGIALATAAVLALGVAVRLLWLDADPYYYDWAGYVTDEGRWVHYAREAALFNDVNRAPLYDLHLLLAPLYQLLHYLTFVLGGGTSLVLARSWTAAFGCAVLLVAWRSLRPVVTPHALFVGIALLAVQADLVNLSRVAVPEMAILFFQAVIYFGLVSGPASPTRMVRSGLIFLLAITMKGTLALSAGVFTLVVFFLPAEAAARPGAAFRNVAWFWAGLGGPLLVAGAIGLALLPGIMTGGADARSISTILGFLAIASPHNILRVPFEAAMAPTLNYLLLGLWLSCLAWIGSRNGANLGESHRRHIVASGVWTASYLVLMVVLEYFPQRYRVQVFLPLAITTALGVSALQKFGLPEGRVLWPGSWSLAGLVRGTLMVLPSAIVLVPVSASALCSLGLNVEPLRMKVACVALSLMVVLVLVRSYAHRVSIAFLVSFPLAAAAVWLAASTPGVGGLPFWPVADEGAASVWRLLATAVPAGAAWLWVSHTRGRGRIEPLATVYAVGFLATSIVSLAPGYLRPHYTIRDTSRDLGITLANAPSVASARAEGMFNGNRLRYQVFNASGDPLPDAVVTAFDSSPAEQRMLSERYQLTETYPIYTAPEYYLAHPSATPPSVRVYRKR